MKVVELTKYIGIPYKLHGRDYSGADCYGLVYLYLKDRGYTLPKYDIPYSMEDAETLISKNKPLLSGDLLEHPIEDCIVLFYKGKVPNHIGVYTQGGILHTSSMRDSVFESIKSRTLRRFYKMEFYSVKSYYTG